MDSHPPNSSAPPADGRQARTPNTYHVRHDPAGAADVTTTVVHALADAMGTDVTGIEFSLHDSVDPEALDRLFAPRDDGTPRPPGHVAFSVEGYRVTVYSGGDIAITPPRTSPCG
ncbi:hypothetical protein HUG12_20765 (plasmid) [Halorarum salinum]|uniref:Halobacterial output domain-containing protein n=1 Tax=Halorarum salinum TaxID=2743089 RepID=A0A7D5QK00_9EURY|nr:hypothetical protein HUG12_20765 [Halobaculum salinum]